MRGGERAGGHRGRRAHPHPVDGDPFLARTPSQRPRRGLLRGLRRVAAPWALAFSSGGSASLRRRYGPELAARRLVGHAPIGRWQFGRSPFGFSPLRSGLARCRLVGPALGCRAAGRRVVCRLNVGPGNQSVRPVPVTVNGSMPRSWASLHRRGRPRTLARAAFRLRPFRPAAQVRAAVPPQVFGVGLFRFGVCPVWDWSVGGCAVRACSGAAPAAAGCGRRGLRAGWPVGSGSAPVTDQRRPAPPGCGCAGVVRRTAGAGRACLARITACLRPACIRTARAGSAFGRGRRRRFRRRALCGPVVPVLVRGLPGRCLAGRGRVAGDPAVRAPRCPGPHYPELRRRARIRRPRPGRRRRSTGCRPPRRTGSAKSSVTVPA